MRLTSSLATIIACAWLSCWPLCAQETPPPLRVKLNFSSAAKSMPPSFFGAEIVEDRNADLTWTEKGGTVVAKSGTSVAESIDETRLQDVVNKWIAVSQLEALSKAAPVKLSLDTGETKRTAGQRVKLTSDPIEFSNVIVFSIAATGEVETLVPRRDVPARRAKDSRFEFVGTVSPQPGAQHFVMLTSERPLKAFVARLRSATAADLPALLKDALSAGRYRIGMAVVYGTKSAP